MMDKSWEQETWEQVARHDRHVAEMQKIPWFHFSKRSQLSAQAKQSDSHSEDINRLATHISDVLWTRTANDVIPKGNAYGPRAVSEFDMILSKAMENRDELAPFAALWGSTRLAEVTTIRRIMDADFMAESAKMKIDELAKIAASPIVQHKQYKDHNGDKVLRIQHLASGLRGEFTVGEDGFGVVRSKPYAIDSIDPEKPGKLLNWERYVGLGIGKYVYQEAHQLEPSVRWRAGVLSDYASPFREKLHASNPYIWATATACNWCEERGNQLGLFSWAQRDEEFFAKDRKSTRLNSSHWE